MTPNQDPKYQAEKCKESMGYSSPLAFREGADFATSYWSKRMVPIEVVEKLVSALAKTSAQIMRPLSMTDAIMMLSEIENRCNEALADFEKATGGE